MAVMNRIETAAEKGYASFHFAADTAAVLPSISDNLFTSSLTP
jgi:hypothetical protein